MMKKLFLLVSAISVACATAVAQVSSSAQGDAQQAMLPSHRTCGTMDNEYFLQQQDPARFAQRQAYEQAIQTYITAHQQQLQDSRAVITIPVVVHVVYKTATQNIATNQVLSQIQVLNEDFGRTNADASQTPAVWQSIAANTTIQFCLAQRDPSGNATNGIDRVSTTVTSWSTNNAIKHAANGGANAWDPTRYLNIWVGNLGGGLLGYGEFPTSSVSQTFGVVILYAAFGSNYTAYGTFSDITSPYDRGRTTTHEFSHCFNLYHIWGDDGGACTGTDYCADTPNQADATFGSPSGVLTDACSSSSPGIMYENYMDYSDDGVMNLFTNNQKTRMLAVLNSSPYNALQTSNGCQPLAGPPSAAFTLSSSSVCAGTGVSFTDNSTGSPTSWSWTFPSGTPATSTSQNPSGITWNSAGTYTVTLVATNANGSSTITHTITINANPTVTATASSGTICAGSSTTLTSTGASTYNWMPGNHNGATFTVTPATTTTYTVTATSAAGCTGTKTVTVTVNPSPTVTATGTNSICTGSSTTLTASGASTYNWMPGNLSGGTFTVTPASTTTYTVTGTSAAGCTNTATITVTVNPSPTVTATGTNSICAGSSTTLTASGASTYNWMPGNHNGGNYSVTPASTTTYTVTGTSAAGCTNTATITVTVNPSPTVTATGTNSICAGSSTTLTASGASTYNWMPGNHNGGNYSVTPASTTTYTVTGTSAAGCTNTATITVTVNPSPTVTATGTNSICAGSSTTLTASGALTYNWMPGNHNGGNYSVTPASTTTYTVTGTSAAGCTNTATITVTVNPSPTVTATGTNTICAGSSTTLTASGASTYNWMPGNHPWPNYTVTPATTTTYTVTGTSAAGCTNTATITVTVDTPPATPSITVAGNVLTSTVTGVSYQWYLNGNPITGATSQSYTAIQSGDYTVEVCDAAGCCSPASAPVTITITGVNNISSNAFALVLFPNPGDGHFHINFSVNDPGNYTLEIYNMLGQIVYTDVLHNFSGAYSNDVDMSIYGSGMYTVRVSGNGKSSVVKAVVE